MRIDTPRDTINFKNLLAASNSKTNLKSYARDCKTSLTTATFRNAEFKDYDQLSEKSFSIISKVTSLGRSIIKTTELLTSPLSERKSKVLQATKLTAVVGVPFTVKNTVETAQDIVSLSKKDRTVLSEKEKKAHTSSIVDSSLSLIDCVGELADGTAMLFHGILAFREVKVLSSCVEPLDNAAVALSLVTIVIDIRKLFKLAAAYNKASKLDTEEYKPYSDAFKKRFVYEMVVVSMSLLSTCVSNVAIITFNYMNAPHVGWILIAASTAISLAKKGVEFKADHGLHADLEAIHRTGKMFA